MMARLSSRFLAMMVLALCALMPSLGYAAPHAEDAGAAGGLPQFDPTWFASQIFWLAIAFGVLYVYVQRVALPRLTGVLDHRSNAIRADIAETERCKRESDKLALLIDARLQGARDQAQKDTLSVQQAMREKSAAETARFQERFETTLREAETRLNAARTAAVSEIQAQAADLAVLAAAKAAGSPADPTLARSVVDGLTRPAKAA